MRLLWLTLVLAMQYSVARSARSINYGDQSASTEESSITSSFVLPKQIFNDGKPFYLEKDPVSGTLDFNLKKSAQAITSVQNELLNPQADKDISLSTNSVKAPNFHDFLNLPVKYSSSKFVYPLVSSSYANLKYQGNNKNYLSNHKNASSEVTSSTPSAPKYYTSPRDDLSTRGSSATTARTISKVATTTPVVSSTTTQGRPLASSTVQRRPSTSAAPSSRPTISSRYTTIDPQSRYTSRGGYRQSLSTTTIQPNSQSATTRRYQTIPSRTAVPTSQENNSGYQHIMRVTTDKSSPSQSQEATYVGSDEFRPHGPSANFVTRPSIATSTTKPPASDEMNLSDLFSSFFSNDDYDETTTTTTTTTTTIAPRRSETTTVRRPSSPSSSNERERVNVTVPNLSQRVTRPQLQVPASPTVVSPVTPSTTIHTTKSSSVIPSRGSSTWMPSSPPTSIPSSRPTQFISRHPTPAPSLIHNSHASNNPAPSSRQPPTHSTPQTTKQPSNFVKFDVSPQSQASNGNGFQYKPVSSMNNIVISPDQDSAAFVLGSQQAVGSSENIAPFGNKMILSGADQQFVHPIKLSDKDHYDVDEYSHIGFSTMRPQGFAHAHGHTVSTTTIQPSTTQSNKLNVAPNSNGLSSSVRFPADNYDNAPIIRGTFKADEKPMIADSLALAQQGVQQHVAFPQSSSSIDISPMRENQVFSSMQVSNGPQQPQPQPQQQQHTPAPSNDRFNLVSFQPDAPQQQQQPNAPHQQQQLPQTQHQQYASHLPLPHIPQQLGLTQPPQQSLIGGNHAPTPIDLSQPPHLHQMHHHRPNNGFVRPPIPPHHVQRPPTNNDHLLPNILPQFRPNTIKINGGPPKDNIPPFRMPNSRPPFIQTPNGIRYRPPVHFRQQYPTKGAGATTIDPNLGNQIDNNRRYYQIRQAQNSEKIFDRILPPPSAYLHQRPSATNEKFPFMQQSPAAHLADKELIERKYALLNDIEGNYATHSSVVEQKRPTPAAVDDKAPRIEPVVTLQMIQQQKLHKKNVISSAPQPMKETIDELPAAALLPNKKSPPVYVVYPMQKNNGKLPASFDEKETIVLGKRGSQKPIEIVTGSEYQNTPFTVIRQEQKPILSAKPKPSPLQKQVFPYALERVKENYANGLYNLGEEPTDAIPRVINKPQLSADVYNDKQIINRETERPIAIAYTPTEPSALHKPQLAINHNDDVDEFGNHYQHNFDAPFFPSVNLEGIPTSNNGWAVVTSSTHAPTIDPYKLEKRNDIISPSLMNAAHTVNNAASGSSTSSSQLEEGQNIELNTEKFNIETFKPELQSGFKPLFTAEHVQEIANHIQEKSSNIVKKDDSIEALIYEDSGEDSTDNSGADDNDSEMTTLFS